MRLISFVLHLTLATCAFGESTQLLQIPRVMRKALGSRNYQIQVPNVHPVEPPQPDSHAEVEVEESPVAKVEKKLAKHQRKAAASSAHSTKRPRHQSGKDEKKSAKSRNFHAVKSSDSSDESESASKHTKLRKTPKTNKNESDEGEDQAPVTRPHYRKRRHTSTTTKATH